MRPAVFPGRIAFEVNGQRCVAACNPDLRLSQLLRDELGLMGTKVGCDAGDCGACTVMVDGAEACACLVPAAQLEGAHILTVEGLAAEPTGRALQRAFHARGAAQCGICSPGMLMAAFGLLKRDPEPSRAAVEAALGGVLCRCTGYLAIIDAVLEAGRALRVDPVSPETLDRAQEPVAEIVGARIARLDGRAKLDGSERYGADAAPRDALWLRAIRSPHARARFRIGDLAAYLSNRPGLFRVLTAADVPGENAFGVFPGMKDQPVFALDEVRHRGEAVAAVVGSRAAMAQFTLEGFPIVWEPLEPVAGIAAALGPNAPALHAGKADNVLVRGLVEAGDIEAGLAIAAHRAAGAFETSFVEHAYIEPEAGHAVRIDDRVEIFASTQAPYLDRDEIARILGVELSQVRIVPSACGGGFGGKLDLAVQPMLAVAAWTMGVPVGCAYTRPESMASTTKRHPAIILAEAGCDATGRLTAYRMDADFDTGAYASWGPTVIGRVPVHGAGPYRVPNVLNRARAIHTNGPIAGAFRGFGVPQAAIAHEALYDELADQAGLDRLEFRHLNALRVADETATGQLLGASAGLAQCLEALRPTWRAMLADAAAFNKTARAERRGAGIGCMWYGIGNTALPNPSTMRIALDCTGRLVFFNGAVDIGQGSTTVLTQIAAQALGLPVGAFTLVNGDTDRTLDAGKTSASRQTFVSGKAAEEAALALRVALLRHTNAAADARLALEGRRLLVEDAGAAHDFDLAALPTDADGFVFEGVGSFDPPTTPLDARGQGVPYATYGFAAQIVSLDVDCGLGTVRLGRFAAAHDVGRAINPTLIEGQIHGGIAQGIGLALMEDYVAGRTENLHDYLIPTVGDVPPIDIHLIEAAEPLGPFGAKGVGEPALVPAAAAILSAIRHATGVTMRRVPVLPHRLRAALKAAGVARDD